jgi:hypothetical protein
MAEACGRGPATSKTPANANGLMQAAAVGGLFHINLCLVFSAPAHAHTHDARSRFVSTHNLNA